MNQTTAVLNHLKTNTGIAPFEAFNEYGATRLADIVYRLRSQGHDIVTIQREKKDRYGTTVRFAEYRLVGE